ncbi:YitT family protein [Paenibacillus alginolyticus]|uniref:YitT family protein n=1 Tax=Paenibacillus alginolyticus TaxID=59839 RepID=A0ABT4GCT1_9BACL|nr:YitT family protein [Paenibacillus alginolyticus]MCY9664679.1 YitT family protein [Paenibacillus alginolyticus]MCY9693997.1 YitT family protein [Paenibacillus alginolyticus]MEC0143455.1 YitT family protein [Paenibacillus alginolyticus]
MRFKERFADRFTNVVAIMIGTAIYAFGLHYFVISNELMEGGVTGVSLLLKYVLNVPPSLSTLLINIPLFYIGWKNFGKGRMLYTIFGVVSLSFFLWIMELLIKKEWLIPFHTTQDYFLATLYAGITLGAGLGLVFRFGGTTGGSDILAHIGNKKRGWSVGQVILIIDVIVIGSSLIYLPKEKVLYSLVAVFVSSRLIDYISEGAYAAKVFTIISDQANQLAQAITTELDRGVTLFPARGAYSGNNKEVVYCVVYRHETRRLRELIHAMDPSAFIIIGEVHDVIGEGFKKH